MVDINAEENHGGGGLAESAVMGNEENRCRGGFCFPGPGPSAFTRRVHSASPKKENMLLNIVCNIAVPTVVLMKFSTDRWLGPLWGLVVALIFPVAYGLWDFTARKKTNFISILGFVSVLLSGGLGLMKADGFWFAVKDAAVPSVIGIAVLVSLRTKTPLVNQLFYNDQIVDVPRVDAALAERGERAAFDRLMRSASIWLAVSFLVSAVLNFGLARYVLKSPPATPEFNEELGKMHILVWPVIVIPSMVVMMTVFWKLISGLTKLTGLTTDEIFKTEKK
jgi:hypothetical protein